MAESYMAVTRRKLYEGLQPLTTISGYPFGGVFRTEPKLDKLVGRVVVWVDPVRMPDAQQLTGAPPGAQALNMFQKTWSVRLALWETQDNQASNDLVATLMDEYVPAIETLLQQHVQGLVNDVDLAATGLSIWQADFAEATYGWSKTAGGLWYRVAEFIVEYWFQQVETMAA